MIQTKRNNCIDRTLEGIATKNGSVELLLKAEKQAYEAVALFGKALDELLGDDNTEIDNDCDKMSDLAGDMSKLVVKWRGMAVYRKYLEESL